MRPHQSPTSRGAASSGWLTLMCPCSIKLTRLWLSDITHRSPSRHRGMDRRSDPYKNGALARREAAGRPALDPATCWPWWFGHPTMAGPLRNSTQITRIDNTRSMDKGHAGQSASSGKSRSACSAPDRHPDGPGRQARSAQRIEQAARRAAPRTPHRLRDKVIRCLVRPRACQQESVVHRRCASEGPPVSALTRPAAPAH